MLVHLFFFFKQKTAYEMRISDWSSDVCSSDLLRSGGAQNGRFEVPDGSQAVIEATDGRSEFTISGRVRQLEKPNGGANWKIITRSSGNGDFRLPMRRRQQQAQV